MQTLYFVLFCFLNVAVIFLAWRRDDMAGFSTGQPLEDGEGATETEPEVDPAILNPNDALSRFQNRE